MAQGISQERPLVAADCQLRTCVKNSLLPRALRACRDAQTLSSPYSPQIGVP